MRGRKGRIGMKEDGGRKDEKQESEQGKVRRQGREKV